AWQSQIEERTALGEGAALSVGELLEIGDELLVRDRHRRTMDAVAVGEFEEDVVVTVDGDVLYFGVVHQRLESTQADEFVEQGGFDLAGVVLIPGFPIASDQAGDVVFDDLLDDGPDLFGFATLSVADGICKPG